jgi:hypothetical protein
MEVAAVAMERWEVGRWMLGVEWSEEDDRSGWCACRRR